MILQQFCIFFQRASDKAPVECREMLKYSPQDLAFRDMMGLLPEDLVKTQWKGTPLQRLGDARDESNPDVSKKKVKLWEKKRFVVLLQVSL